HGQAPAVNLELCAASAELHRIVAGLKINPYFMRIVINRAGVPCPHIARAVLIYLGPAKVRPILCPAFYPILAFAVCKSYPHSIMLCVMRGCAAKPEAIPAGLADTYRKPASRYCRLMRSIR